MESIKEIEQKLLKDFKKFNIDVYDLSPITDKIKRNFTSQKIKEFNKWNIRKHPLSEEYSEENKSIRYSKDFYFKVIEEKIKKIFDKLTKEDKIKEVMPSLMIEKVFNEDNQKYFSLWDFQKRFLKPSQDRNIIDTEKLNQEINSRIKPLKEICLSGWGLNDNYRKQDRINEFLEFLKYAYDIDITISDLYNKGLKTIESEINQNKEVKIKLFNGWYYLTLTDEKKQEDFKNRLIEQIKHRISSI